MMDAESQTVHVIEDEPAVLRALMRVLTAAGHQVRGYGSSEEFLAAQAPACWMEGCIVADVSLPGMTGLDLQERLRAQECAGTFVFITANPDVPSTVRAMRSGALNFLIKPVDAKALVDSVEEALDRSAKDRTRRARLEVLATRIDTLTARERQVFELVVCGRLNKQIAWEFGVGEKTIKVHRARVMRKMGAQTLAQLVHMADELHPTSNEVPERATASDDSSDNVRAHAAPLRPASKSFATTAS